jgi:hypothetical protein
MAVEAKPYKIFTSIHKLPLNTFIDCFVDHDYSGLIIEGECPDVLLQLTWNDLVEQYNDAIKDDGQKEYVSAFQDYQKAKLRHDLADRYIELLHFYFKDGEGHVPIPWVKALNKLVGAKYKFEVEKKSEFIPYLKSCSTRNKGNLVNYQLAEKQLLHISSLTIDDKKKEVKQDHGYFIQIMINLKSMEGREIPNTISVYEFCLLVNKYKEWLKINNDRKKR